MDDTTAAPMTLAEFARHLRRDESWIRRLRDADRLVMTDDGRIVVAASMARLAETSGARPDVAARHADAREARVEPATGGDPMREARRAADLRRAQAAADLAEIEASERRAQLLDKAAVLAGLDRIGVTFREGVMQLPARLCYRLAGVPAAEIEAIVEQECRATLEAVARELQEQARELRIELGQRSKQ